MLEEVFIVRLKTGSGPKQNNVFVPEQTCSCKFLAPDTVVLNKLLICFGASLPCNMAYIELLLLDVCIACLSSILGHAFFVGCCKKKKPAPRPVASIRPMSLLPGGLPVLQPSSAPAASNTPEPSAGKNEPPKTSTADIKKEDESKQSAKSPGKLLIQLASTFIVSENKKKAPEEKTAPDDQDPGN